MRALFLAVLMALAVPASGVLVGCSSTTKAADLAVGDCLKLAGPPDRPQATKAACGSEDSNFKVVAVAKDGTDHTECPADVDSSYSSRNVLGGANSTLCLDVDWVLGSCMSVDPDHKTDPFRVGCNDASAPHRHGPPRFSKMSHPRSPWISAPAVWATPTPNGGSLSVWRTSAAVPRRSG